MNAPHMGLCEAVTTLRSAGRLLDLAPTDSDIERLLGLAMNAPDHAYLRPWRLTLLRKDARNMLGEALMEVSGSPHQAAKPLRAPLLIGIVLRPQDHPKVPKWEQLAATVGVITILDLLLHGEGWAAAWQSGPHVNAAPVRRSMQIGRNERLLGFLYVGRPDPSGRRGPRPDTDPRMYLSNLPKAVA